MRRLRCHDALTYRCAYGQVFVAVSVCLFAYAIALFRFVFICVMFEFVLLYLRYECFAHVPIQRFCVLVLLASADLSILPASAYYSRVLGGKRKGGPALPWARIAIYWVTGESLLARPLGSVADTSAVLTSGDGAPQGQPTCHRIPSP